MCLRMGSEERKEGGGETHVCRAACAASRNGFGKTCLGLNEDSVVQRLYGDVRDAAADKAAQMT